MSTIYYGASMYVTREVVDGRTGQVVFNVVEYGQVEFSYSTRSLADAFMYVENVDDVDDLPSEAYALLTF